MNYEFTALDPKGGRFTDSIESPDLQSAQQELMQRGLLVLEVTTRSRKRTAVRPATGAAAVAAGVRCRSAEIVLFAKQMGMMLQAGASVVPALRALQQQPGRPAWHSVIGDVAERVEGGAALHEALQQHPLAFSGMVRSIVRAGETTGQLGPAFLQLAKLLETRHRAKSKVIGALGYPAILLVLAAGVVVTTTLFILPRFATLFEMLNTDLPLITTLMLDTAQAMKAWWPVAIGTPIAAIAAAVLWLRSPVGCDVFARLVFRVPMLRRVWSSVLLTQLLQLWGAALKSRVPLLEAIQQGRDVTSNVVIREMVDDICDSVRQGQTVTSAMRRYPFVPAPVMAAVATGEESGKLGESLEFVGAWLDEESSTLIASLTRIVEPAILILMGVIVGTVAISLFLPLFELATAA